MPRTGASGRPGSRPTVYAAPVSLLLGPVLRHVDTTSAVIWVQTTRAGTVSVHTAGDGGPSGSAVAGTFEISGHHFALVTVSGLAPDSAVGYRVELDGEPVWPPAAHPFPPSLIRTRGLDAGQKLEVVFGSCRYPKTGESKLEDRLGPDALDRYATRMAGLPPRSWPDLLVLLGDQVYADELTPEARRGLAGRRRQGRASRRPPDEVVSFGEYVRLYEASWSDPEIRWLLSTVPTAMIFDDHDVRDDWNTSAAWRTEMAGTGWWADRIRAALASYWVYQHLGNLSPAELERDQDYRALLAEPGDRWPLVAELADRADRETDGVKGVRFSFSWQLGRNRLVMIDSRNGRILTTGERAMLSDREFRWVEDTALNGLDGVDHLILASSLPWLLPPVISELQSANERAADRPGPLGRLAEAIRQIADLEHWPAFDRSFVRFTGLVSRAASSDPGPASVSVISGDVHHSYAARAELPGPAATHQLVCSPLHNYVPGYMRPVFRLGWSPRLARWARAVLRPRSLPDRPLRWDRRCGPLFGNTVATLRLDERRAEVLFEQPDEREPLTETARLTLS